MSVSIRSKLSKSKICNLDRGFKYKHLKTQGHRRFENEQSSPYSFDCISNVFITSWRNLSRVDSYAHELLWIFKEMYFHAWYHFFWLYSTFFLE